MGERRKRLAQKELAGGVSSCTASSCLGWITGRNQNVEPAQHRAAWERRIGAAAVVLRLLCVQQAPGGQAAQLSSVFLTP